MAYLIAPGKSAAFLFVQAKAAKPDILRNKALYVKIRVFHAWYRAAIEKALFFHDLYYLTGGVCNELSTHIKSAGN